MIPGEDRLRTALEARRRLPWELRYQTGTALASRFRRLVLQATHLHCRLEFGENVFIGPDFTLHIPHQGSLIVGDDVQFRRGFHCEIDGAGRVSIDDGSAFTSSAMIQCTTSISIGKRVTFGQAALIVDGNHRFRDSSKHLLDQGTDYRPISIGDHATVLTKVTILSDIGEGSVIAAHSVVTRPIPAYCLAGGVPARVIEYFGPEELRPADLER
jgi:acetyltransferase-like isoleucine patch superfamily enzyme